MPSLTPASRIPSTTASLSLLASLVLLPLSVASAQAFSVAPVSLSGGGRTLDMSSEINARGFNKGDCDDSAAYIELQLQPSSFPTVIDLWHNNGSVTDCTPAAQRDANVVDRECIHIPLTNEAPGANGILRIPLSELAAGDPDRTDNAGADLCSSNRQTITLYLFDSSASLFSAEAGRYGKFDLHVDGVGPSSAPTPTETEGSGQNIPLAWSAVTDGSDNASVMRYRVFNTGACGTGDAGSVDAGSVDASAGSGDAGSTSLEWTDRTTAPGATTTTIDLKTMGLPIGSSTGFQVAAVDQAGNVGARSATICLTREVAFGFCEGVEGGCPTSCQAGDEVSPAWALLLLLPLALRRRRRGVDLLAFLAVFASSVAFADSSDEYTELHRNDEAETFLFELKVGTFAPSSNDAIRAAFDRTFASEHGPLLQLEVDGFFLRIPYVGQLGAGVAAGWARFDAQACTSATCQSRTSDEVSLRLFPVATLGVLRIDALARHLGVPFVVTGRLGADFMFYNEDGPVDGGAELTMGLRWGAELAFELDVINPRRARALNDDWGINHTYLLFELFGSSADFGTPLAWSAGLGLAF